MTTKVIEAVFWVAALTVVLFINISPQVLKTTSPAFLIVLLVALLVILAANLLPAISSRRNKILFSVIIYVVVFLAVFLFFKGLVSLLSYYYLPIVIAMTMAFLIMAQPKGSMAMLIAVCTFLLGEAFWSIQVGTGKKLVFPGAFLRVYALSLVTIFSYYLYQRELKAQAELKLLNQKLKSLDNLKSEFVANVSHELRTPLTSIKNACVILKKAQNGAAAQELLDIIDSNVDRQSHLINNLLDLAKIEKGKIRASRSLVDMGAAAKQVVSSLAISAKNKGVSLKTDIEPALQNIYGSLDQLAEVYTNLIDNAIKYTPTGGSVLLKIESDKGGIKSTVADTGIGIREDDIAKLFDRFKRLEAIMENKTKGTGLGLAITKEIVELHGGRIWVESQPGKGSKFTFILPLDLRRVDKPRPS